MGKALPKWVLYNIIHTHARAHAVGFTGAAPAAAAAQLPSSAEKSERTKSLVGQGPGPSQGC